MAIVADHLHHGDTVNAEPVNFWCSLVVLLLASLSFWTHAWMAARRVSRIWLVPLGKSGLQVGCAWLPALHCCSLQLCA